MAAALPFIALASLVGGTALKATNEIELNEERQQAISNAETQEKIAADNRTLIRDRELRRVVSTQQALIGTRGINPASASFTAINQDTFDQWAKDNNADNLSLEFNINNLKKKSRQFDEAEKFNIANDIFSGVSAFASSGALTSGVFGSGPAVSGASADAGERIFGAGEGI